VSRETLAAAAEADARWFQNHRGRSYRIRAFVPGEFPVPQSTFDMGAALSRRPAIVVRQIYPGLRLRQMLFVTDRVPLEEVTEGVVAALWRALEQGFEEVSDPLTPEEEALLTLVGLK
jgi:hypothetical protein